VEWELVASLSPTVEGKGGLTSHTRSPTLAMNGKNPLLDRLMQKALFSKKCRVKSVDAFSFEKVNIPPMHNISDSF
jgi:hypothetical protein